MASMELHEGHEGYVDQPKGLGRGKFKRASRRQPTGSLHAVRAGGDVALCTEDEPSRLRVHDSGDPWRPSKLAACRRCRELAPGE